MTTTTAGKPDTPRSRTDIGELFHRYGTFCIFVLLILGAHLMSPAFLTERNIMNVLRQISGTGIMAVGMLLVILTRGIDLSVGSVSALGSVLSATLVATWAPEASTALVVLAGARCGLVTGILVAYLRLPAFVMTLAMMTAARGLSLIISNGQPILLGDSGQAFTDFGAGFLFGVPQPVILMFAVFIVGGVVLGFTKFGRIVRAIGSNEEAVRLSGIAVPRYVCAVYVVSGALAALAGIISTARAGVGSAQVGVGAELAVIAAVVIGGASLMGGRGGAVNTLLGAMVMGVISNIMNLANVPGYHQQVLMGAIIVIAVLLQHGTRWLRRH